MDKVNRMLTLLVIIVSVALVYTLSVLLLDNTGKINQGKYKVNDVVLTSTVNVDEKNTDDATGGISGLKFELSQTNVFSMLISKDEKYNRMYIDNMYISKPNKVGEIYMSQPNDKEEGIELTNKISEIEVYPVERDEQYLVELKIDNMSFLSDVTMPDGVNKVVYDGTILENLGIDQSELNFKIKFDLNIIDVTGVKNTCKIELNLPYDDSMGKDGIAVNHLLLSDFKFKVN